MLVWQKAHRFVLTVYGLRAGFPRDEVYGLTSQMRRAAVPIAANIAEGFRKRSDAEKARFLDIAQGSIEESRYYLILLSDLAYGRVESAGEMLEQVSRLMNGYSKAIRRARRKLNTDPGILF